MKKLIILLIFVFFSVQGLAQTDSQEVAPTDETSKTNLSGEYIYASSYFKKSKTGIVLKYAPGLPTVFYGWRFVVYNTEKFFIGGTGFIGYHLAKQALKKGWDVSSISSRQPKKIRYLKKVKYIICDITKKKILKKKG